MDRELEAYRMPITKIIEDQSVKDISDVEDHRFRMEIQRLTAPTFRQEPYMRPHFDNDRTVTINREKLVEKLKQNRAEHEEIYNEACVGYYNKLREALKALSLKAHDLEQELDGDLAKEFSLHELTDDFHDLSYPRSYIEAYDEAIELFTWDEATQIELKFSEFRKLVLDKWDWQMDFLASSEAYGSARALRKRIRG